MTTGDALHEVDGPQACVKIDASNEGRANNEVAKNEAVIPTEVSTPIEPLYSVFTSRQKRMIVMIVSFLAMISPLSSTIYYPATTYLATEFHVSDAMIQLTITTYQVSCYDYLYVLENVY